MCSIYILHIYVFHLSMWTIQVYIKHAFRCECVRVSTGAELSAPRSYFTLSSSIYNILLRNTKISANSCHHAHKNMSFSSPSSCPSHLPPPTLLPLIVFLVYLIHIQNIHSWAISIHITKYNYKTLYIKHTYYKIQLQNIIQ